MGSRVGARVGGLELGLLELPPIFVGMSVGKLVGFAVLGAAVGITDGVLVVGRAVLDAVGYRVARVGVLVGVEVFVGAIVGALKTAGGVRTGEIICFIAR